MRSSRLKALLALLLLVPVPGFATWIAMHQAEGLIGQLVFVASKGWILLLPLLWHILVDRQKPTLPRPAAAGMAAACITGSIIVVCIATAYWWLGRLWFDVPLLRERLLEVGLATPAVFIAGAVYWCTINSLLEEYVWRWFVFIRCETVMPRAVAVIASGLFFTLHHIIALKAYADWRVTALGSLGVFIGGATWSWLYLRYRNIWAAYVSHVFADVIIFLIGYQMLFGS